MLMIRCFFFSAQDAVDHFHALLVGAGSQARMVSADDTNTDAITWLSTASAGPPLVFPNELSLDAFETLTAAIAEWIEKSTVAAERRDTDSSRRSSIFFLELAELAHVIAGAALRGSSCTPSPTQLDRLVSEWARLATVFEGTGTDSHLHLPPDSASPLGWAKAAVPPLPTAECSWCSFEALRAASTASSERKRPIDLNEDDVIPLEKDKTCCHKEDPDSEPAAQGTMADPIEIGEQVGDDVPPEQHKWEMTWQLAHQLMLVVCGEVFEALAAFEQAAVAARDHLAVCL